MAGLSLGLFTSLTLKVDHRRDDCGAADLQDSNRRCRVVAQVSCDLQPRPFEPAWFLREPQSHGARVPLVNPACIEDHGAIDRLDMRPVRMNAYDRGCLRKPATGRAGQLALPPM